jgi:hypothetical protein
LILNWTSAAYTWDRGGGMNPATNTIIDQEALKHAVIEIKLSVNRRLFEKNVITEEMYTKAKELILRGGNSYQLLRAD